MGEGKWPWFARLVGANRVSAGAATGQGRSACSITCFGIAVWVCLSSAWAATPAGTVITNAARVSYDDVTAASNSVTVVVSHVASVEVTPAAGARAGRPGDTVYYPAVVTNTGNGADSFSLRVASDLGWTTVVYLDQNADGVHQPTETTVLTDTGVLPAGARAACLVGVTVPSGAAGSDVSVLSVVSMADPTCAVTASYTTDVVPGTVADFSALPTSGEPPLTVSFTDLSPGDPVAWQWAFGDGGTSSDRNPVHVYQQPGSYTVSLTIATPEGPATATKRACVLVGLQDIGPNHWAHDEIMACVRAGIIGGYSDGSYQPDLPVSRAQMAGFVARALAGGDENVPEGPPTASFRDVPTDHWAFDYVEYAQDRRVVLGHSDGLYHPDALVNRGEMAVFVARSIVDPTGDEGLAGYVPPDAPTFDDVTETGAWSWSRRYVEYVALEGIASGYADGLYHPERTCSRDQMAVFFARAFDLLP